MVLIDHLVCKNS